MQQSLAVEKREKKFRKEKSTLRSTLISCVIPMKMEMFMDILKIGIFENTAKRTSELSGTIIGLLEKVMTMKMKKTKLIKLYEAFQ